MLHTVKCGVLFLGFGALFIYYKKIVIQGYDLRSPSLAPLRINFGVIWSLAVAHCAWPLLFDASCVFYLVSEVSGVEFLVQGTGIFIGAVAGCLFVARIVRAWWSWLLML